MLESSCSAQDIPFWGGLYLRYLQLFRKLENTHDQIVQPQKRADARTALEACMGRVLEIRHWLVGSWILYVQWEAMHAM